jgi:phospholipid/cholesterol/gamma-HCH transport system substrate-binding protein
MNRINIETGVGIFLVIGLISLGFLSVKLGGVNLFGAKYYSVKARFSNISGLKEGATVEIAGVQIGKVAKINLDDYDAVVEMDIDHDVKLQEDSIASIRTQGIIGDKFIKIKVGGSDDYIEDGGEITETESAIELEELVSKYIFEKDNQ